MRNMLAFFLLITTSIATAEYHTFTAQDGRTLEAKVIMYDATSGKVQIEREDGKSLTVPITAFIEDDQDYINKWEAASAFLSTSKLKLDLKRDEVDSTKTKIEVDMNQYSTGRRSGTGIQEIGTDEKTEYRFILTMKNGSKVQLDNMSMEYRIYYNQEKAVIDEERSANRQEDQTKIYEAETEEKVKDGEGTISALEAKGEKKVATKSIKILERNVNGRGLETNIKLKGELHGIWIKVNMPSPDGEVLTREIAYPPSIPKKFAWDPAPEEEQKEEE